MRGSSQHHRAADDNSRKKEEARCFPRSGMEGWALLLFFFFPMGDKEGGGTGKEGRALPGVWHSLAEHPWDMTLNPSVSLYWCPVLNESV